MKTKECAHCRRPTDPRHAYCGRCEHRLVRHGSPAAVRFRPEVLKPHERDIESALYLWRNTRGAEQGRQLAASILNYTAHLDLTALHSMADHLCRLRNYEVTPNQLLVRVTAFVQYAGMHQFKTQREEDYALARVVLRLAPVHKRRLQGMLLRWTAEWVRAALYPFAVALLRKIEERKAAERELRRASMDFDSPAMEHTP